MAQIKRHSDVLLGDFPFPDHDRSMYFRNVMAWQAIQMEPIDEMLASFLVNVVL